MHFTKEEKEAINCILIKLMKADGHTDLHEAAALFQISKSIGLSINEADNSLQMEFEDAKSILSKLNTDKKAMVSNLFNEMVASDGKIDITEQELLDNIFKPQ